MEVLRLHLQKRSDLDKFCFILQDAQQPGKPRQSRISLRKMQVRLSCPALPSKEKKVRRET